MRAVRGLGVEGPGAVASALAATEVGSMVVDMIADVIDEVVRIKILLVCLMVVVITLEDIRATLSLQLDSAQRLKPQLTVEERQDREE
jgi:hypothetical protein